MSNLSQVLIVLVGIFVFCSAHANVYEYIDEEGIAHYSDSAIDERYILILTEAKSLIEEDDFNSSNSSRSQFLDHIQQSAQNNQIDSELIHAVIHVESAFKVQAKSPKGAQGLMQLMPATAQRMRVSNSYDPAQNIEGGAKYLRELLNLFNNDVSLALAAYNAGENAVIEYGNKIPPYKETQTYVPKVLNIYKALMKQRKPNKQMM